MSRYFKDANSFFIVKWYCGGFPCGPVVKTLPSSTVGVGSIPGQGTEIPHALQPKKTKHKTEAVLRKIQ